MSYTEAGSVAYVPEAAEEQAFQQVSSVAPLSSPGAASYFIAIVSMFEMPIPQGVQTEASMSVSTETTQALTSPLTTEDEQGEGVPSIPITSP